MFFQLRRRAVSWFLFLLLWGHSCPFLHGDIVVHFIDVGQADAILVESDGENMLVDGGNGADSSLIYAYLKRHGIERIKYLVNSHPHEDHVGGLPGALNYATVERGFSSYRHYDSEAFRDYVGYLAMQGLELEVLEAFLGRRHHPGAGSPGARQRGERQFPGAAGGVRRGILPADGGCGA